MAIAKVTAMDLLEGDELVLYVYTIGKVRGEGSAHKVRTVIKFKVFSDHLELKKLSNDGTKYPIVVTEE